MLIARPDGLIDAPEAVVLPFMAPRLQGELAPDGRLTLALWGEGDVGEVRLAPLAGPIRYAPNRAETAAGGFWVAQSAPVVLVRGARPLVTPPPQGVRVAEDADGLRIAVGATPQEAERALALPAAAIAAESEAYVRRCDLLPEADPVLRSMVVQGAHAALAAIRQNAAGGFAGLAAGAAYSSPARTYYRDAYWTTPLLLRLAPDVVRWEIDLLAQGVQPDGEAPSGVVTAGQDAWERRRLSDPELARVHTRPGEWWSDHFDSPLLFALMVADYVAATRDPGPAERHRPLLDAIAARYRRLAEAGGGLPLKPRHDRDWADNVFRSGAVAYDLGLWFATLADAEGSPARAAIDSALWRPAGWYADYAPPEGPSEDHLALDSLTLLRFGAATEQRARSVLAACRARLETRRNRGQPCGDWGTMCAFPPYASAGDLRDKSAQAFRYHNGGDWPWLDGIYADERLKRGLPGWRYPLLRWWEVCLERGWLGAVEHLGPVHGAGSLIQAWSSLPAAVALAHRSAVLAGDPEATLS